MPKEKRITNYYQKGNMSASKLKKEKSEKKSVKKTKNITVPSRTPQEYLVIDHALGRRLT